MGCVYDNVTDTEISVKRRKVESHSAPLSYLPQHPNRSPSGATPPQPPQPLQLPPDVTPCLSTAEGSRHPSMSFGAESSGTLSVHPGAHDIPDPSIEANQATGMQDPPSEQGIPSDFRLHALEAEAVYLLRFLPSLEHSNLYALGVCADFILPPSILQQWIGIIVSELGERLSSGDPGVYQAICRKISSTTTRPLYIKEGSPVHQQIELMAGLETLRWEVVGILLAALGLAVVTSKSDSVLLQHVQDEYHGPDFLKRLLQACEHCQAFLGGNRDINQLFICLDLALVALYRGLRQEKEAWIYVGEVQNIIERPLPLGASEGAACRDLQLLPYIRASLYIQDKSVALHTSCSRISASAYCFTDQEVSTSIEWDRPWLSLQYTLSRFQDSIMNMYPPGPEVNEAYETLIQTQLDEVRRHRAKFVSMRTGVQDPASRIKLLRFDLELLATRFLRQITLSASKQLRMEDTIMLAQEILETISTQKEDPNDGGTVTYLVGRYGMLPAIATAIAILRKNVVPVKCHADIMHSLLFYRRSLRNAEAVETGTLGTGTEDTAAGVRNTISIREGRQAIEDVFGKYGEGCEVSKLCERIIRDTVPRHGRVDAGDFLASLKTSNWEGRETQGQKPSW